MMGYLIESFAVTQVLKEVCIQALPSLFCLSCFGSIPKVIKRKKTLAEEALQQINDKRYALPFEADGRKLFKIGINFSEKTRNIEKWVVES